MRARFCIAAAYVGILLTCRDAVGAEIRLSGRVVDENGIAVPATQIAVTPAAGNADARRTAVADRTGNFSLLLPAPGDYLLKAEREGYFRVDGRALHVADDTGEITVVLNPAREVFEHADVAYSPPQIDFERTTPDERLTNTQVLEIPYASTNTLRNAMRAMPGMVQDSRGGIHLNGGAEEQVLYTLDGFEVNDPLTGRFDSRLSVESVRSMEIASLTPAEFGKGASGALEIRTSTGDDKLRYSGTNFLPGIENKKGIVVSGWTPRFNVSGPIWRGRAWFSEGFDIQYDQNIIDELPAGQDRASSWRLGNLLRNQFNITPANTLYTSFLWNRWASGHDGLGALSPKPTTVDQRSRQYFTSIKDQWAFARGALVEVGYARNRTFARDIPQGHGLLYYTPEGQAGYAFLDNKLKAGRDQILGNVFLPSFHFMGSHQLKTGVDVSVMNYWQDAHRTGYVYLREDRTPVRSVAFAGSGEARRSNSEFAAYLQDSWKPHARVLVEAGVRQDWDRLLDNVSFAPRLGISWAPPHTESMKISAGYGWVYEETNLRVFTRPLDQYAVTTYFTNSGGIARGPLASVYVIGNDALRTPRYTNYSAGVEQRFRTGLYGRLQYIGRRGRDGLTYTNVLGGLDNGPPVIARPLDAVYLLRNQRRDVYDAVTLTLRQTFRKQYEWQGSYTRSRAFSNAVTDVSIDTPTLMRNNVGRMPWDAPNRLVSWGYLPSPLTNWSIAYLMEVRNGYPFSIQDAVGATEGEPNARRFPMFFELNLHLERRFVFHNNRWAFRFGFNNITNHKNPNVVNNDSSARNFLAMYGGQSRALNFRLRWLGR